MRRPWRARRQRGPSPPERQVPADAWFDAHDAHDQIAFRASTAVDQDILESWVRDGYVIVEGLVPPGMIDAMLSELDALYFADEPVGDLRFFDLEFEEGTRVAVDHAELTSVPPAMREVARDRSAWRVHQLFESSPAAAAVMRHSELVRIASLILGTPSEARYSINFQNGSRQELHEDTAVFHLAVPNLICGAWIACEDIEEGCGPLLFFPGSHRRPMFAGFDRYPMTNLRTADYPLVVAYRAHLDAELERYERRTFLARKGDVLFWHGALIHGGEPIRDTTLTRRSYVLHFIPDGIDVASTVTERTNW